MRNYLICIYFNEGHSKNKKGNLVNERTGK